MTALAELVVFLEERIGLDAESIGIAAIERAIRQRREACGMADDRAYWDHLRGSETELQELVECLVVPETWFFRDREALTAAGRLAAATQARRPDAVLRLLSLPCSTGEEPYSIAMALLDAGLAAERFRVDGIDISARALALARRAVYGRNSFRGSDLEFRERYFTREADGYHLNDRVRQCVQFRQDNLLSLDLVRPGGGYDVIFCRNVLIYFALPAQERALQTLHELLAPAGLVFVGPAETSLMLRHGYVSAKIPLAFAFHRAAADDGASAAVAPSLPRLPLPRPPLPSPPSVAPPARHAGPPRMAAVSAPAPAPPPASPLPPGRTVADIERLANQGRLAEAAAACDALIRDGRTDVEVYYLAGVVHGALGHTARAAELYRKVLYLNPLHADALAHLAYLLEAMGDPARADVFRDRARRARERVRE